MSRRIAVLAGASAPALRVFIVPVLLSLLLASCGQGSPVTAADAQTAVMNWLVIENQPLGEHLSATVREVRTYADDRGLPLYYVVSMNPSGYVIVSPDDLVEPIIAFSPDGDYDPKAQNPMYALVVSDLTGRVERVRSLQGSPTYAPDGQESAEKKKWDRLLAGAPPPLQGLSSISDLRVDKLVQSKWHQAADPCGGNATYNYYTPPGPDGTASNYPSGCVATAIAQLLRFWQYPTAGIGVHSFTIYTCGSSTTGSTRGGNGSGGAYAWASMDLDPCNPSLATRQAIGALCYDAGLSVNTDYCTGGSGADTLDGATALKNTFGYSDAHKGYNSESNLPAEPQNRMINANLHAGCPVILGITGSSGGHAVVCDGYGYNLSTMYHHLNMGWSGNQDAWYNLPNIDSSPYSFSSVYRCIYNVFKSQTGEIIAGRVTDSGGSPISGVSVTATPGGSTDTTDSKGIYGLLVASGTPYTVTPQKPGWTFAPLSQSVTTGNSTDYSTTCGNQWPVDFEGSGEGWQCSTDVPKSIPDPGTTTSTLTVSDSGCIQDVNVKLTITHPFDEDLDVYLIHPNGTRIALFTDVGGSGDNFTDTILDDQAGTSIVSGTAPFTGTYKPEGLLSAVNGKPAAGVWTLEVTDDYGAYSGALQSWCLQITTTACGPTVANVTSDQADGCYKVDAVITNFKVEFTEAVNVTGTPRLRLDLGTNKPYVNYVSGTGATTLTFASYTVVSLDTSADLCYDGTTALILNGGTIVSASGGLSAVLDLPACGAQHSLSYNKSIIIDTAAPTVSSVVRSNPTGQYTSLQSVVWRVTFNEDVTGVATEEPWDFELRVISGPISGHHIVSVTQISPSVYDVTVDTGSQDGELALDVPASATIYDCANNEYNSDYTIGQTYNIDKTPPQVFNVTSAAPDGSYNANDLISIQVSFDEVVFATPTPQLELETGAVDRKANCVSAGGIDTLTFTYTVQAGDVSPDLDYKAAGSLSLNGGTIKDAAGNNANLTLPSPGQTGSLGYNKSIVIGTGSPPAPSKPDLDPLDDTGQSASDNCTRNTSGLTLSGTAEADSTVKLWNGAVQLGSGTATGGSYSIDISLSAGETTVTATATDAAGNQSAASEGLTICVDTSAPDSSAGPLDCGYTSDVVAIPFEANDSGCGMGLVNLWYRCRPLGGGDWGGWTQYSGGFPASPISFDTTLACGQAEYEFYTIAVDKAGNTEAAPAAADCGAKVSAALCVPTMQAEPEYTRGTSNEVSWTNCEPIATQYRAQCATDVAFASIYRDSGWQNRPPDSHTFTGLSYGQEYFYRSKVRSKLCDGATGAWTQTAQADFDADTLVDVSTATSPGAVVLAGGGAPVTDTIGNTTSNYTGAARARFNAYQCTVSRTLTQIEIYLNISTSTEIQYAVYESGTQSGTYTRIHSNTVASSGTGQGFYSSGAISVPLQAGKYYIIGAGWSGSVTYYQGGTNQSVAFGQSFGYSSYTGYPGRR